MDDLNPTFKVARIRKGLLSDGLQSSRIADSGPTVFVVSERSQLEKGAIMSDRKTFKSIPVIDISGLYSDNIEQHEAVAAEVGNASRNVGFFVVKGHHVAPEVIDGIVSAAKDLFSKSDSYKRQYYIGSNGYHNGYVPMGEERFGNQTPDYKEAFDCNEDLPADDPKVLNQKYPLLGPINWPDIPSFRERTDKYFQDVQKVGQHLWRGFSLALGLPEDAFRKEVENPPSFLRMIHYPPNEENTDAVGISSHTDYEAFTILLTLQSGLEVMNESGDWISVPLIPGTFVVNIGDTLESMTDGQFLATTHRVRKVKQERYSFPLFFSCAHDTAVKPLPQFDSGHSTYTTTTFGAHLWASLVNTYEYLSRGVEEGRLPRPENWELGTFGHQKK